MTENKNYEEITLTQEVSLEEAEIIAKDTKDEIKYPFIIKYDTTEKDNLITLIDRLGCDIVREMDFVNCIAVSLNMKQLEYIKKSSSVTYVETNCTYNILDEEASRACAEYAIQHVENICKENDKKVKIAVFDTGVNEVEFKDAVCFVNEDKNSISNDHGIELIKIISSANENEEKVDIYSVKVCDENGCTTTDAVMSALKWAIDNGMHIVNMCFESTYRSNLLATIIKEAVKSGVTIVTANSGTDITYPADFAPVSSAEVDNLTKIEEDDTIGVTTVMPRIAVVSDKTAVGYTLNSGISLLCEGDECPDNGGSGNGNTTTSSSNTMATAFDLPFGSVRSGCISLPYDEHWYRFVAGQRKCTIYSTGYTDVIGYLYDECGNQIASNDDYGGYNNFRINIDLTQGATYYIKVKAYSSTTGGYMIIADERILPTAISISSTSPVLNVGETLNLSASVSPNNATNKSIIWTSSNPIAISVGLYTGVVTAHSAGFATITATCVDSEYVYTEYEICCDTYLDTLINYFGFGRNEALLIRSLYDKVDTNYPDETNLEKAWRSARALGGIIYGENTLKDAIKWNDVAGFIYTRNGKETYFVDNLGFTTDEYNLISNAINNNYRNSPNTDFAHMQISLAARLAYKLDKDFIVSNILPSFSNDLRISYLAGWLGDATILNEKKKTSLPNSDYHADLDAENIYWYIIDLNTNINALNKYYNDITSTKSKVEMFLEHISLETVKENICNEFNFSDDCSESDKLNTVCVLYPDTYNFIMSLQNKEPNIKNYY